MSDFCKRTLVYLGLLAFAAMALFVAFRLTRPTYLSLPEAAEVDSLTATIFEFDGFSQSVPEFVVPTDWVPKILGAFQPARKEDYGNAWDHDRMGRIRMGIRDGRTITIEWPFSGKQPLCFQVDGDRFIRDGSYYPVSISDHPDGAKCVAECVVLSSILTEIHRELITGDKSPHLIELVEILERSHGLRPPETTVP